jgi:hypothetical protein
MKEAGIFLIIFAVLVTILAGVVRLLGGSFGLDFGKSWFLCFVALALVAPAVVNIHIFASAQSRTPVPQRLLALIRGIGMLVVAATCTIPIFSTVKDPSVLIWGFGLGFLMNFGTLPLEHLLNRKR